MKYRIILIANELCVWLRDSMCAHLNAFKYKTITKYGPHETIPIYEHQKHRFIVCI